MFSEHQTYSVCAIERNTTLLKVLQMGRWGHMREELQIGAKELFN